MEGHPSFPSLRVLSEKYPKQSQSLFQAYNDILYAQQWIDVEVKDISEAGRAVISGKISAEDISRVVVPCSLAETFTIDWLKKLYIHCSPQTREFLLAIVSDDSSLVYYKISKGIVKPPM
ncbi:tRNA intron endonuclease [Cantharellus anzutake]|uniref:tRNA intron endonuclease n=1 Tax=Cantharellus anzutake TaxID=1750568 RepID=UPI001904246A|nr:tRNA intron endonuclease [Cantharellus anzutake]KAF8339968.1 tRNA intron endonuclease [Cantharellus anzutake]